MSEKWATAAIVAALTIASLVLMLRSTSPELSWDEADYASSTYQSWAGLWSRTDYVRHDHGVLPFYLAKLGAEMLPEGAGSSEDRRRFFDALAGSLGVGLLYWSLRSTFGTSRAAAAAGAGLLLFSVIRLEETYVLGPHAPMLLWLIVVVTLGYRWLNAASLRTAILSGLVFGCAALTMTWVVPLGVIWLVSITAAKGNWLRWDRWPPLISPLLLVVFLTAVALVFVLWPPAAYHRVILREFLSYLHHAPNPTLVGTTIVATPSRSALAYWLLHLEAPTVTFAALVVPLTAWRGLQRGGLTARHLYLGAMLLLLLAITMRTQVAGARNLLPLVVGLCLVVGAFFDEVLEQRRRLIPWAAAGAVVLAAGNDAWLSHRADYIPFIATDGYRQFVAEHAGRLREPASAIVFGIPILRYYGRQAGVPAAWTMSEMPWTADADSPLPVGVKYALLTEFGYRYGDEHSVPRVIDATWRVVWTYKQGRTWGLRLYERP